MRKRSSASTPPLEAEAPTTGWRARLAPWFEGLGGEPTVIVVGASAMLVVSHYQGSTGNFHGFFGNGFDKHPWALAFGFLYWFLASVLFYMVLPLIISVATRGGFHQRYGFGLGDWRVGLSITGLFLAVMLPATWAASHLREFQNTYPLAGPNAYTAHLEGGKTELSWGLFLTYEAGYLAYFIAWEFFFRGWLVQGLLPKWGRGPAILVQVLPFVVMHYGKAELETLGSIIAGVALGILAVRTRSFWYGALIHGTVAIWMDWLCAKSALLGA